jgi:hypothetical protein
MSITKQLSIAKVISFGLVLLTTSKASAITFTKIADTTAQFSSFGLYSAINDAGTVAFQAGLQAEGSGIFVGSGGETTTIANTSSDSPFSLFSKPVINDGNTVVFEANLKTIGSGIFTVSNGTIATIAESQQPRGVFGNPVINNQGTVVFSTNINNSPAIELSKSGGTTTIVDNSSAFTSFDDVAINNANNVAFSATFGLVSPSSRGIFVYSSGPNIGLPTTTTVANTQGDCSFVGNPAINDSTLLTVAFNCTLKNGLTSVIGLSKGGTTTYIGGSSFTFFDAPAINNAGTIAFEAGLSDGSFGIFTGSDPVLDKVIASGDSLLGSTVTNLFFSQNGLNNNDQVTFYAQLANGTSGIFRADLDPDPPTTPVPEPDSVLGTVAAGVLMALLRRERH